MANARKSKKEVNLSDYPSSKPVRPTLKDYPPKPERTYVSKETSQYGRVKEVKKVRNLKTYASMMEAHVKKCEEINKQNAAMVAKYEEELKAWEALNGIVRETVAEVKKVRVPKTSWWNRKKA